MPVQFNKKQSTEPWYSLTYQSNSELNEVTHHNIKVMIAQVLVEKIKIKDIYSYVHGTIIFSINTTEPANKFEEVIRELNKPFAAHTPSLLLSIVLVQKGTDTPPTRFMYVEGNSDMDVNFKKSIEGFYPPPQSKTQHFSIKK